VLLTPVDLGPVTLANRVVSTSHQTGLVHDHLPTDDLCAYHEARARGGVGAIFLEATAVDPSGLLTSHTLGGFLPGIVAGYRTLADAVHEHDARLLVQLFHGGREQISAAPRAPAVAPSAVPSPRFASEPRALTALELRGLIDGYATAARHCREGGIDGIEVSMSHGYLIAQFFAQSSNRRTDEYGIAAGRLRFAEEVLAAVRAAAGPGLAVGVRLAADELAPEGLGGAECAAIARELCATGLVDFASFVLGHSAYVAASSWIAPPPPTPEAAIAAPLRAVRDAVDVPVIGTTRVVDIAAAARLVESGAADAVGMTRALIADPDLVEKASSGRVRDVLGCIGCNQGCIGHYHAGVPIGCLVNPRTGRERTLPRRVGGARELRVLVVGAGPAGVAAAVEAAGHGDTVTLVDRAGEVGGQLRLAGRAPAHHELWRRWRANAARQLEHPAIALRLGEEAGAAELAGADVVVLASGARPFAPDWAGDGNEHGPFVRDRVGGPPAIDAWTAIANPASVSGPVLVADWGGGWEGLDAAEVLAEQGLEVTLASASPCPGSTLHQYQRNLYLARLDERGIAILHHTEVTEAGLRHLFSGRMSPLPAVSTIVYAQGREPEDELWAALEGAPGRVRAGDVLGPRSAEEATLEGVTALQAARAAVS
jgi:2,4-dienoyl-CoA reductase-like NADH-dependent reductase (Old Yellow Enzyme family)/threonine dehydrogenase-like Zn-dependent dehydrogenase